MDNFPWGLDKSIIINPYLSNETDEMDAINGVVIYMTDDSQWHSESVRVGSGRLYGTHYHSPEKGLFTNNHLTSAVKVIIPPKDERN